MAWIESHQEMREHPKTKRLARLLGIPVAQAIGHLHCLWWWAVDYAPDGDLTSLYADAVAGGAGWDGDAQEFIEALIASRVSDDGHGYVERTPDGLLILHDWDQHVGRLINKRRADAERLRTWRERNADETRTSQVNPGPRTQDPGPKDPGPTLVTTEPGAPAIPGEEPNVYFAPPSGARKRAPDPLWDTALRLMGYEPKSSSERGAWNKALGDIRKAECGSAPADIAREFEMRFMAYHTRWPDIDITLPALAKHWSLMAQPVRIRGRDSPNGEPKGLAGVREWARRHGVEAEI